MNMTMIFSVIEISVDVKINDFVFYTTNTKHKYFERKTSGKDHVFVHICVELHYTIQKGLFSFYIIDLKSY